MALIQRGMLLSKLTYPAGTRFEIEKFGWVGSLNSETAVTLAWNATSPHRTAKDLFEQELIVGGIVSVDPETTPRLYNSLIGTKFKIVIRLQQHRADRARDRARRGAGHRRLVMVELQGGAAGLDPRQEGHDADAGRVAERSGARAICRTRSTSSRTLPTAR